MSEIKVTAIIPAGGSGSRVGGLAKQFRLLCGKRMLLYSIECFRSVNRITDIVLVLPEEMDAEIREEMAAIEGVHLTTGGATRTNSVANGLSHIDWPTDIVFVHDAARPFVTAEHVNDLIDVVVNHGAAAPGIQVTDTMRRVRNGVFTENVDRDQILRVQTPQVFDFEILKEAHALAEQRTVTATDDVALVQTLGHPVQFVPGLRLNFKVTTPEELTFAESLMQIRCEAEA